LLMKLMGQDYWTIKIKYITIKTGRFHACVCAHVR
jgi:hypothetical protein